MTTVSATLSGVTGNDTLAVKPPNLLSLIVSPNKPNVAAGRKLQFSALGKYTDGSVQDLTSSVAWSSSDTATATISTASGSVGLATALALGTTEIGASSGSVSASPVQMTVTATIYAYATNYDDNTVSQYVLGSAGSLTPLSAPAVPAGQHPFSISVEPTGEYVYVSNWGSSSVSQYRIGSDGTLSVIGSDIPSGASPNAVTIDHADRFAYVANLGDNTVSQYKIGLDGVLIPLPTPKVASGAAPAALVVDPTNRFAYEADLGANSYIPPPGPSTISQYSIGADGSLTPMSVPTVVTGNGPNALVIDPTGKYLYVANLGDNTIGQYTITTGGSLTPMTAATVPSGTKPVGITVDPSGHFVYVANAVDGTISQYAIDPLSGGLAAMTPAAVPAGGGTSAVSGVTVDPTGKYLYATIRGAATISQFNIGAGGALTPMTNPTVTSGLHPTAIATGY
jgi:6-phosphogluconolactonase (cycloisomerase 2 family)